MFSGKYSYIGETKYAISIAVSTDHINILIIIGVFNDTYIHCIYDHVNMKTINISTYITLYFMMVCRLIPTRSSATIERSAIFVSHKCTRQRRREELNCCGDGKNLPKRPTIFAGRQ